MEDKEALVKRMVDRFLSWKLPKDLIPDGGISYKPIPNHQPVGTNFLTATQAKEMIEHILADELSTQSIKDRKDELERADKGFQHKFGDGWTTYSDERLAELDKQTKEPK